MKKLLLLTFFFVVSIGYGYAQRTVTGNIVDESNEPLVGASVAVKGTTTGTITDFEGNFRLTVPAGSNTLLISYTGYLEKEVSIENQNTVTIVLQADTKTLDEFVVVGYGTQRKADLTGSIASIRGEDIALAPVQSFDQALQGRAAGVNIITPNGVLNNPPVFRIRGINSINLSSQPLFVIDGVPTFSGDQSTNSTAANPLGNINPADIESIEILKDASASAIYGSRAAAGVVLITTKKGKQGTTRVNYDGWVGANQPVRLFDLLDADQYMLIKNEAARNAGFGDQFFPSFDANGNQINTNWYDYTMRTGLAHNHNLSFSGGNDKTNYYLSMGYTAQEGMIQANSFDRTVIRLNLDHKLSKKLTIGTTASYALTNNAAPNTGSLPGQSFATAGLGRLPLITAPNIAPYINDQGVGAAQLDPGFRYNIGTNGLIGIMNNLTNSGFFNAAFVINENFHRSENNHLIANVYLNYALAKGLNFRTTYGIDRLSNENITFWDPRHGDGFGFNGLASNSFDRLNRWNWQNVLQYDVTLADLHTVSFLAGNEQQYTDRNRWGAFRQDIADPFFRTYQGNFTTINPTDNLQTENYLISYFGRLNYDFMKKLYVSFNFRRDGYSAFAPGQKYGNFYGASAGYTLSEEGLWKDLFGSSVNYFKVRGSYGVVGNSFVNDFASLSLYGSGLYGPSATLLFAQAGNPLLSWETSTKTDVGFTFGLFNDKIQGEFAWYQNNVDGLILAVPQAPSKGIPGNSVNTNIGAMVNDGIELTLTYNVIRKRDFSWSFDLNFTTQRNVVNALGPEGSDIFTATAGLETVNITRIGESIGSLYVVQTDGVNPQNGRRIFLKREGDGFIQVQYDHSAPPAQRWTTVADGAVTSAPTVANSGVLIGPTLPTWFGGLNNTVRYKNFDLNLFLQFQGGNWIYNGTQAGLRDMRFWNNHTDVLDRWTPENTSGSIPRVVFNDNVSNGSAFPISENVQKGDFLRIRNLVIGYSFPRSVLNRINVTNLRIYAQMQNPFVFTGYTGADPEISTNGDSNTAPGIDRNTVGQARSYTFGVNIGI